MHDIRYDAQHDEVVVPNQFAQAILTFAGGASGETAPRRVIQGPQTQLIRPERLDIDPVHNEIVIPNSNSVLVFDREATGNAAPIRVIEGPKTLLRAVNAVAVDPIHNVIIAASQVTPPRRRQNNYTPTADALVIFDRTANGNVAPLRVINGENTGLHLINQLQVYPDKGWVIVTQSTTDLDSEPPGIFVGVWSIEDGGDVAPRWKIAGPMSGLKKPRGVAFNARNKELIVADMRRNAVLTYYFPALF